MLSSFLLNFEFSCLPKMNQIWQSTCIDGGYEALLSLHLDKLLYSSMLSLSLLLNLVDLSVCIALDHLIKHTVSKLEERCTTHLLWIFSIFYTMSCCLFGLIIKWSVYLNSFFIIVLLFSAYWWGGRTMLWRILWGCPHRILEIWGNCEFQGFNCFIHATLCDFPTLLRVFI